MSAPAMTGGCQCGAVRFAAALPLGRASLCHCRMCQKAFGGFFGPLVSASSGVAWTRGAPRYFQSSNLVRRGFCAACGTPLTFEPQGGAVELAIGAFDEPAEVRPTIQLAAESRPPWFEDLTGLPWPSDDETEAMTAHYAAIISYQHPDHDTE